jgi:2-polyprenyl-6-methoxyphenol hydroxylase-like FAD-dependent oxidoreductase
VTEVVIAGAGPNGLMLACELGLAGIRPVVLDPMPGPNPQPRVNRIVGQAARILDHRGLFSALTGTADPPKPAPRSIFAGFPLDLASVPGCEVHATAVLVRPDSYVAWASSRAQPDPDELRELRSVLTHWFGI